MSAAQPTDQGEESVVLAVVVDIVVGGETFFNFPCTVFSCPGGIFSRNSYTFPPQKSCQLGEIGRVCTVANTPVLNLLKHCLVFLLCNWRIFCLEKSFHSSFSICRTATLEFACIFRNSSSPDLVPPFPVRRAGLRLHPGIAGRTRVVERGGAGKSENANYF